MKGGLPCGPVKPAISIQFMQTDSWSIRQEIPRPHNGKKLQKTCLDCRVENKIATMVVRDNSNSNAIYM